jgi:hypothetical protein
VEIGLAVVETTGQVVETTGIIIPGILKKDFRKNYLVQA